MASVVEEVIRSIEQWLRFAKEKPPPCADHNLDPVLLVPGIAGSILHAADADGKVERVWVRFLAADRELRGKLWSRFDPSTGQTISLDKKIKIFVPEDRYGLYAIDVLDPDLVVGRETVYYFHDMIEEMIRWGFEEGKTLFGFGFDFRQSNRLQETLDRFSAKLQSVYTSAGGKKVSIITHSMGALLVRCFMSLHSDIFEKYVKNWIAIAAPFQAYYFNPKYHYKNGLGTKGDLLSAVQIVVEKLVKDEKLQSMCMNEVKYYRDALGSFGRITAVNGRGNTLPGAPGYITTSLLNGMSFVEGWEQNFFVSKWSMHQLLIECPSVYELLANPKFSWSNTPLLQIWRERSTCSGNLHTVLESYESADAISIMNDALSCNMHVGIGIREIFNDFHSIKCLIASFLGAPDRCKVFILKMEYDGEKIPLPFNLEILKWADETRQVLSNAKLPSSIKFYNIYGVNNDTPNTVCYGSEKEPISDLTTLPWLKAKYIYANGDGSVPAESAKADGFDATARVAVAADHRGIICNRHVFRIIRHWLKADHDPFYDPVNDYVILPTAFDIESHCKEHMRQTAFNEWEVISHDEYSNKSHELTTEEEKNLVVGAALSASLMATNSDLSNGSAAVVMESEAVGVA